MKPTLFALRPGAIAPQLLALIVLAGTLLRAEPPPAEGATFVPVFNGRDLAGWALQARAIWRVENGELIGRQDPAEQADGWLFSETEWSDFALELEFKVPEKCNTGIALRMPKGATGSPDVHGYEVQISDLPERTLTGSLLHHTESKTNNLHRANEWNRLAITCEQDRILIQLNGLTVLDVAEKGSRKGRIGMQVPKGRDFAGQEVRFRNLRVKEIPPRPAAEAFVWKGDCSKEATFVGSSHPTIPGHYEYLPDPKEPARGLVFAGHLTPEFTTTDPEKFHLHPDIYFDRFLPGSITVRFDVQVDDLAPSELGPYGHHPWLNLVTLFDETTVADGKSFRPSVMVNLVGTPGTYCLQAYSIDAAGAGTFYQKIDGGPVFPIGKWVTVRLEVDVKAKQVRVHQGNALASTGPYKGKPGLAGAHMGLYANRKMTRATVFNDNITLTVGD